MMSSDVFYFTYNKLGLQCLLIDMSFALIISLSSYTKP
ncbi:hypothetical protein C943_01322 [Mariniradius saccharolyticus AK6]|uniref:Uncharacterized protein n=1 Tax=Mariniradius saccharolyticus AK6 TaxID=1239962 RepID=M7X559_9BACT|nr:hypothetical protein C943_01322 [Mariniradius saccharolyticus AK6]